MVRWVRQEVDNRYHDCLRSCPPSIKVLLLQQLATTIPERCWVDAGRSRGDAEGIPQDEEVRQIDRPRTIQVRMVRRGEWRDTRCGLSEQALEGNEVRQIDRVAVIQVRVAEVAVAVPVGMAMVLQLSQASPTPSPSPSA